MTAVDYTRLTRRLDEHRPDCWRVWWTDICAGWIAKATTINGRTAWQWRVAMYGGSSPGEGSGGSADDFEQAKAAFLRTWMVFASSRKPEDFEACRDHRDFTEWKYGMHDRGMRMPTQNTDGRSRCFCGCEITIASVDDHVRAAHRRS